MEDDMERMEDPQTTSETTEDTTEDTTKNHITIGDHRRHHRTYQRPHITEYRRPIRPIEDHTETHQEGDIASRIIQKTVSKTH
jgi:hypothetical protein